MARLREKYQKEITLELQKKLNLGNKMAVPRLEKIVVSMGVGKATENKDLIPAAVKDLAQITGQHPLTTRAKKSVAGFKLRKDQAIGCKVTLRGARMYEFLDRLINVVIPRFRDFRGLNKKAFDGSGNYNMGIEEQVVFPEINIDNVKFNQGMDIAIVIKSKSDEDSYELLKSFGMPFRN